MDNHGLRAAFAAALLLLTACAAPPSRIESNRAPSFQSEPKRVFVVSTVGNEFGPKFAKAFEYRLQALAKACGADVEVSRISPVELDGSERERRMVAFGADTVLSIARTRSVLMNGQTVLVAYDTQLFDPQSRKVVWRAEVRFPRGANYIPLEKRGEALAVDMTNRMKEDRIFRSCPTVQPE